MAGEYETRSPTPPAQSSGGSTTGATQSSRTALRGMGFDEASASLRPASGSSRPPADLRVVPTPSQEGPAGTNAPTVSTEGDAEAKAQSVAKAAVVNQDAPTIDEAPAGTRKKKPEAFAELKKLVATTRKAQIARIKDLLDDVTITNGDVSKVLAIHQHLDGPTIVAIMETLHPAMLADFISNLNTPHVRQYRREVLECCFAAKAAMFGDLDTDVIEDMNLDGLSPREHLQVGYVLRNMPRGSLKDVLDSKKGVKVKGLLRNASGYSAADFEKANDAALATEQKRAGVRTADATAMQDTSVLSRAKKIEQKLDEFHVSDGDATTVLAWMTTLRKEKGDPIVGTVARYLEDRRRLDRFIEELPSGARWRGADSRTFFLVLRARPPEKNLAMAQDLLSYGAFDWAIADAEAKLAYYLVKSMPPAVQDTFRRAESGQWFVRMEHQQSTEMMASGEYRGVEVQKDESGQLVDVAEKYAKKLNEAPVKARLDSLLALAQDLSRENALSLFEALGSVKDETELGALVRRLDARQHVQPLIETLGHSTLFAEPNRAATLRLFSARDTQHVLQHARDLLTLKFFTDWAVTSEEAFLAFHLIKALPEAERAAFMSADAGEWWAKVEGEMSQEMRESASTTFYKGGKGHEDRDRIRATLLDDETWSSPAKLDGFLRMARFSGDGQWAFDESKRRETYKTHPELARKHRLYHPESTPVYVPEQLAGTNYAHEAFGTFETLGAAIDFVAKSGDVETQQYLGGTGLSAPDLQDVMGGSIMGARLKTHEELGEEGKQAQKDKKGANFVDAKYDLVNGVLDLHAPDLRIAAINKLMGQTKLSTGEGTITGLDVTLRYPTADNPAPAYVEIACQEAVLNDVTLVHEASIQTANRVGMKGPSKGPMFKLGAPGITKKDVIAARDTARIPAPILGGVISSITNLVDVIFFSESNSKELSDGFKDPRSPMAMEINVAGIDIEGANLSHGQTIGKLSMKDLRVGGGTSRGAYLRAKLQSLDRAVLRWSEQGATDKADKAREQRATLAAELEAIRPKEDKLQAMLAAYHAAPADYGHLAELEALQAELGTAGGLVVDIGELSASGIDGMASADDVTLKAVHGEGSAALAGLSVMTNASLLEKVASDSKLERERDPNAPDPAGPLPGTAEVGLSVDSVDVTNLRVRAAAPTLKELDEAVLALEKRLTGPSPSEYDKHRLAQFTALRPKLVEYADLKALGLTQLDGAQRLRFQALQTELQSRLALEVDSLHLDGATLAVGTTADKTGLTASIGADSLLAMGVRADGREVDTIRGQNVKASAEAGGLTAALDAKRITNVGGGVTADSLTLEGLRDRQSGLEVQRAHVEGLDVGASDLTGNASAHAKARSIEIDGINLAGKVRLLEAEYAKLAAKKESERTAPEQARFVDLGKRLGEHRILRDRVTTAEQVLAGKRGTTEEAKAQAELQNATKALGAWSQLAERIVVKDLDVLVSGLGNVTEADYDPMKHGFKVSAGASGKLVGSAEAWGVQTENGAVEHTKLTDLTGEVDLSSSKIAFKDLGLGALAVSGLNYRTGGTSVSVTGAASVNGLNATGSVSFREVKDKETGESKMQPAEAQLDRLDIVSIAGTGIGLHMPERGMNVAVPKGTIGGIWAEGFKVGFPEKEGGTPTMLGKAGLGALDLQLKADLTKSLGYQGSLSGSAMNVDFAADDKRTVNIGGLDAHGVVTSAAGSSIKVDLTALSGTVVQQGDKTTLKGVSLQDFTVGQGEFAGDGLHVRCGKQLSVKGAKVDAEFTTKTVGEGPDARTQLENVVITTLDVKNIDAQDVHATQDAVLANAEKGIEGHERRQLDLASARIVGLHADGVDLKARKGNVHVPSASIQDLHVALGDAGKETLEATASLSAKGLDMKMLGPDHQLLDFGKGVSLSAHVKKDGTDARVSLTEVTGKVERSGDKTTVRGVSIQELGFAKGHFQGDGKSLDVLGHMDWKGITVDAEIETQKVGDKSELKKLLLTKVIVEKVTAKDVAAHMDATQANPATGIKAQNEKRFALQSATIDWLRLTDVNVLAQTGNVHVDSTDLGGLSAAIGPKGKEALKLTDGALRSKGFDLTLKGPSGQLIDFGNTSISGHVKTDDGVDAKVDAQGLRGKADLRDDGATLENISLDALNLPYAKFEAAGTTVEAAQGAFANPLTLKRVEVKYKPHEPHQKRELESVIVTELGIPTLTAPRLTYGGLAQVEEDGKTVRKQTNLSLTGTTLTGFVLHSLDHNVLTQTTKADIDTQEISAKRLTASLKKTVGGKDSVTNLTSRVLAKGLDANVTAQTVQQDGNPATKITGSATLDHLGLSRFLVSANGINAESRTPTFDKQGELTMDKDGAKKALGVTFGEDGTTDVTTGRVHGKNIGVDLGGGRLVELPQLTAMGAHVHFGKDTKPEWAVIPSIRVGAAEKNVMAPLFYNDPAGMNASVMRGLAEGVRLDWTAGKLSKVHVDKASVEQGSVDLEKRFYAPPKKEGEAAADGPLGIPKMPFLKSVSGDLTAEFHWKWDAGWYTPEQEATEKVAMHIKNGVFDQKAFEASFGTRVDWFALDFTQDGNQVGLKIGSDTVWITLPDEARKQYEQGGLELNDFLSLVEKYGNVAKAKPPNPDSSLKALDQIKLYGQLTVAEGENIPIPGGSVTVGKTKGGAANTVDLKAAPTDGISLDLTTFAFSAIDWKSATTSLKTGHVDIENLKADYDIASGKLHMGIKSGTVSDIDVGM